MEMTRIHENANNQAQHQLHLPVDFLGVKERFTDIAGLEMQILNFHNHEEKKVFVKDGKKFVEAESFKGIYNTSTQKVDGVMSQRYRLIKHKEAMLPLIDALKTIGLTNVSGYTACDGKRAYTMMWFDDHRTNVEVAKGDILKLGVLLRNSVDGSLALWGEVMCLRLVCSNGMVGKGILNSFRQIHLGSVREIKKEAMNFYKEIIVNLTEHSDILKDLISRNIGEMINSKLYDTVLSGVGFPERHVEKMLESLKKSDEMTKWDLYNHVTAYITHELERGKLERRLTFLGNANKILTTETSVFEKLQKEKALVAK